MAKVMKLAIIGAATGQLPICLKARQMGVTTICFAWEKGAVCRDKVDKFYPISITEKERIAQICAEERIDGVVSNASDATAEVASYIATKLHLHGIDYGSFLKLKDKAAIRELSAGVEGLSCVRHKKLDDGATDIPFPCIVKPVSGNSKKGVAFASGRGQFEAAVEYARSQGEDIIVEEYIGGQEISVETLSFEGTHHVIQITDKESSGAPHFVELAHHQPSALPEETQERIRTVVPALLDRTGLADGAAHVEMKVDGGRIYLIEINPRGGGDEISNTLVELSTGYDYVRGMIETALGIPVRPKIQRKSYSGIYYLCSQSKGLRTHFESLENPDWLVRKQYCGDELSEATGNYDRNGSIIYCSDHKIIL